MTTHDPNVTEPVFVASVFDDADFVEPVFGDTDCVEPVRVESSSIDPPFSLREPNLLAFNVSFVLLCCYCLAAKDSSKVFHVYAANTARNRAGRGRSHIELTEVKNAFLP